MFLERIKESRKLKIILYVLTVGLIVTMMPRGESLESEVSVGSIWIQEDLIASMSFPILKPPDVYRTELEQAKAGVYPVFIPKKDFANSLTDSIKNLKSYITSKVDSSIVNIDYSPTLPHYFSRETFSYLKGLRLRDNQFSLSRVKKFDEAFRIAESEVKIFTRNNILDLNYEQITKDSIAIRYPSIDQIKSKFTFIELNRAHAEFVKTFEEKNYSENEKMFFTQFGMNIIRPNLIYSSIDTEEEITNAQNKVSRNSGLVNENERIVAKHDRITREIKLKIDSYKTAKGESIGSTGILMQIFGNILHIASLITLISIYIYLFRKKIFYDNTKLLVFSILFVWICFVAFMLNQVQVIDAVQMLIFIPTVSMLITIIFDSRIGFYTTVITSLIVGALRGNDYAFVVMNIVAGALSVYTVRDIKNRTQIFRSFLYILIGYVVTISAFGLERFANWQSILVQSAFAATNALISPVLTYGLLIFFERIFNITTDLTLLELSNFERPLLRELARKAPGSFSHSLTMGMLAESASEAIGANTLLARVGAYYHDIGKTIDPQYFVENQMDNNNLHDELSPEESVDILLNHISGGIELAKSNGLPKEIIDFIPMHHGTSTITFFYEKAVQLRGKENVDRNLFRYNGPKPSSKETAIVMLADSCESAVRSITEPDVEKIENLVTSLINARIEDNQLDDAPLTFSDLTKIKEAFIKILLSQHHRRIRYPKQEEMEMGNENGRE